MTRPNPLRVLIGLVVALTLIAAAGLIAAIALGIRLPLIGRIHIGPVAVHNPDLQPDLDAQRLALGAPIFVRIFKHEAELELWVADATGTLRLLRTYPICAHSGALGPKLREGDLQAPEGFYFVKTSQLNPNSRYHLAFNIGYPNAYDRAHERTGSAIMVHGDCVSIGCFAMTDAVIEDIYAFAAAALEHGQPFFRVHIFPFRMTDDAMAINRDNPWFDFWTNLKEGYDYFEDHGAPPDVQVHDRRYTFHTPEPLTTPASIAPPPAP